MQTEPQQISKLVEDLQAVASDFIQADLASRIAHQITNPLTIILSRASFLKDKIQKENFDKDAATADLKKIEDAVERIAKTVRNICTENYN